MSPRRAFPIRFLWTTWVVGVLGVGLAVLVNWPLPYCELRVGTPDAEVDGTSGGSGYVTTVHGSRYAGVPWRFYERVSDTWLLERWHAPGPETRWYPRRLVGNILLAALLIVFAMSYWQMRSRRARRLLQITLSDIVIAMLAIGMGFGGWRILQDRQQRQSRLYHAEDVLGHETTVRLPESVSDWLDSKHVTCLTTCTWLSVKEPTSDRLRELGTLRDLELLKIRDGSYAAEDLAVLSRLPRLRMLGLSGTPAARGFLDQRSTLTNLHALHLHEVPLTDQDLALLKPLQGLTLLRLEDTAITDAGFQHLAALRGLKRLRVLSSRLDGSGIQALSGHPRLESFQFWEPQFFGSSIALPGCSFPSVQLSDMPELRSVEIMADVARSELHELPQLRTAVIAPTSAAYNVSVLTSAEVSLAGLPAIQRLLLDGPNLRRLDLDRLDTLNRLSLDYTEPAFAPREDSVERRKRRYVVSAETLAAIAESKSLFSLRMANAAVDNAQLSLLAKLPNLRELYLRGSNLDDEGLEHLGRMPRLWRLYLSGTEITQAGWSQMPPLQDLYELDLAWTQVDRVILKGAPRLQKLSLQGMPLRELTLVEAPVLEGEISLKGMPLESLRLVNVPHVDSLRLDGEALRCVDLRGLGGLQKLDLTAAPIGDDTLAALADCQFMMRLNLQGTEITDHGLRTIGQFSLLDGLNLEGTRITDVGLAELSKLQNVRSLNLTGTSVSDAGLLALPSPESLEILYLGRTRVTGSGLASLRRFPYLQRLSLGETAVSSESLAPLPSLERLSWLRLSDTAIDDRAADTLSRLKRLRTLYLNGCEISDRVVNQLAALPRLQELDVRDTRVTVHAIRNLQAVRPALEIVSDRF